MPQVRTSRTVAPSKIKQQGDDMNKLYDNILDTIGNTPIVRLNKLGP